MARKGFTECPECGCDVSVSKLNRHIRKVHPKKASKYGIKKVTKGRKPKKLSLQRQELLERTKAKERQRRALKGVVLAIIIVALIVLAYYWGAIFPEKKNPVVVLETSEGTIKFELYEDKVPNTVENFKKYVKDGFYEGLIFHRIANLDSSRPSTHIVQTGGFKPGLVKKEPTYGPIALEIDDSLSHVNGAVAMARTDDPDTASSQFYFCDGPQTFLDDSYRQSQGQGRGYAVFGQVKSGWDVLKQIARVPVHTVGSFENVPVDDITIIDAYIE